MKTGPGPESEIADPLVEDRRAGHVRWHQVGRELDAIERAAQHPAQHAHQQRLAQSGHALDQHVALGQERRQDAAHQLPLADEDLVDLAEHALRPAHDRGRGRPASVAHGAAAAGHEIRIEVGLALGSISFSSIQGRLFGSQSIKVSSLGRGFRRIGLGLVGRSHGRGRCRFAEPGSGRSAPRARARREVGMRQRR